MSGSSGGRCFGFLWLASADSDESSAAAAAAAASLMALFVVDGVEVVVVVVLLLMMVVVPPRRAPDKNASAITTSPGPGRILTSGSAALAWCRPA